MKQDETPPHDPVPVSGADGRLVGRVRAKSDSPTERGRGLGCL